MPRRLAAKWASFEREVIAAGAPSIQRKEMRRAFYAGGQALLAIMHDETGPEEEPTNDDLLILDDLVAELQAFAADVRAGRA